MTIAVSMITAPRRQPTIAASLWSLRVAAGYDGPVTVYGEPDSPPVDDEMVSQHVHAITLGTLGNWFAALSGTVQETSADWVLILEDDVIWAADGWAALEHDLQVLEARRGSVGYVSLYLPVHQSVMIERDRRRSTLAPGLYSCNAGWNSWGSQAYVLPRANAEALLADPVTAVKRATRHRNQDRVISEGLTRLGKQCLYRVPCLVSHELGSGLNSSLHLDPTPPGLETKYWTGRA